MFALFFIILFALIIFIWYLRYNYCFLGHHATKHLHYMQIGGGMYRIEEEVTCEKCKVSWQIETEY